ncbi:MAG: YeeE/YedE family protein [Sphingobium sp.]|uniref:YeeE/YedE family protein n=1 Tax=unclassified Sphingobium TaxID=2611147 RepID=UPI0003D5BDB4|nr:hypothetical protein [Sphingobium sp. C100]ETI65801.1 YeeE/YedE family protein [Sphingobium sp. C100]
MSAIFPDAAPGLGFLGGLLIGLASALMLLGLGRIAGISGLIAGATGIGSLSQSRMVAIAFTLGLPLGAGLVTLARPVSVAIPGSILTLILAGLLVGFGTRLGSGCTSGHGICGLSRLSPRSLVATTLFMAAGFASVAIMRLAAGS